MPAATGRKSIRPMANRPDQIAAALNGQRQSFRSFLVARVGSEADADDLLQNGLAKAVQRAGELEDATKLTAWFYQLLRHAVIDYYRTRAAGRRRDDALGLLAARLGGEVTAPADWEPQLCACLGSVVATLPPQRAELLRRVDLNGEAVQDAARALKLTANNASVTLHRARKELRVKLEAFCGACADNACLDCNCAPVHAKRRAKKA